MITPLDPFVDALSGARTQEPAGSRGADGDALPGVVALDGNVRLRLRPRVLRPKPGGHVAAGVHREAVVAVDDVYQPDVRRDRVADAAQDPERHRLFDSSASAPSNSSASSSNRLDFSEPWMNSSRRLGSKRMTISSCVASTRSALFAHGTAAYRDTMNQATLPSSPTGGSRLNAKGAVDDGRRELGTDVRVYGEELLGPSNRADARHVDVVEPPGPVVSETLDGGLGDRAVRGAQAHDGGVLDVPVVPGLLGRR